MKSLKRPVKEAIMEAILAPTSVGISELKANPTAVLEASGDKPVAILNRNKPVGYMLTAAAWEKIHNLLEDQELLELAQARLADGKKPVRVSLDDL
jgi:antitoxin StbD